MTTLQNPVQWGIAGIVLWTIAWGLQLPAFQISAGVLDQIWYAVPVLMLCPFVAVLGARNPGAIVWGWFIVLPMCLVLEISAVRLWGSDWIPQQFFLDSPTLVGFGIVMVMGLGNYLGTKHSGTVLFFSLILILMVAPYSESVPAIFPTKMASRTWATFLLIIQIFWIREKSAAKNQAESEKQLLPFQAVWFDFIDSFGVVWGKRLMDRMNQTGKEQKWAFHLELDGFVSKHNGEFIAHLEKTEYDLVKKAFYRHLKRFVEPEWIDKRL